MLPQTSTREKLKVYGNELPGKFTSQKGSPRDYSQIRARPGLDGPCTTETHRHFDRLQPCLSSGVAVASSLHSSKSIISSFIISGFTTPNCPSKPSTFGPGSYSIEKVWKLLEASMTAVPCAGTSRRPAHANPGNRGEHEIQTPILVDIDSGT